jgi:hypothetical protein
MKKFIINWFKTFFICRYYKQFTSWIEDLKSLEKPPKIKAEHIRRVLQVIKPGDIILRGYNHYVDKFLFKNEYTYSGICVDENNIIYSDEKGKTQVDIMDFIKDCDRFMLLKPPYIDETYRNKTIAYALSYPFSKIKKNFFYFYDLTISALKEGGLYVESEVTNVCAKDFIKVCGIFYEVK